jgi:DNA primase
MTDIELIKSKIDIVDFISEHVALKKAGRHFKGLCPFHSEKTPSFIVSPERQSWYCFGACAQGGDAISFIQKYENLEFVEALKIMADKAGVILTGFAPTDKTKLKERIYRINNLASEFYHYILTSHKLGTKALDYLKTREIRKETLKTFMLGYSPDSWDSLLKFLLKKGYSNEELNIAGLTVKGQRGSHYDRFRGRLMFTLKDHRGNVVGFSGRKLPPQNEDEAKYINTQETPVYIKGNILYGLDITYDSIKKSKEAIIVEGEFDMLSSFQSGVTNVVAIKGSALTEGQVMLIKRYTENLLLALDSDFAGNEAAKRGIEIADNANLNVRVVKLLFGKDPADCIAKAPHLWKESVSKSVPIFDFIIEQAFAKYDRKDVLGKKKIGMEVIPYISKIGNLIVRSHYVKKIAGEIGVKEESLDEMILQFQKKETVKGFELDPQEDHAKRQELLENQLLTLIIQSDNPRDALKNTLNLLTPDDFNLPVIKKIMELLSGYFKMKEKFSVSDFGKLLTPELTSTFDTAYMKDLGDFSSKDIFEKEHLKTVKEVKRFSIRRRINFLSTKLRKAEESGNEDESKKINEETRVLLKKMMMIEKEGSFEVK